MREISYHIVANCPTPSCGMPILDDHSAPWCTACRMRFTETFQRQLPGLQEGKAKARAEKAARRGVEVICEGCGARIRSSAGLDSLGFREITCPNCRQHRTLPLKWGYRITYWVFLCLYVSGFVMAIQSGRDQRGLLVEIWGVFILVSLLLRAILKDFKILYQRRTTG